MKELLKFEELAEVLEMAGRQAAMMDGEAPAMEHHTRDTAAGLEFAMRKLQLYRDTEVASRRFRRDRPDVKPLFEEPVMSRGEALMALMGAGFSRRAANEMLEEAKREADQILEAEA